MSQPFNPHFIDASFNASLNSSQSSEIMPSLLPPDLTEVQNPSSWEDPDNNITNIVESLCVNCSLLSDQSPIKDLASSLDLTDPLLSDLSQEFYSPRALQFTSCAREILEEIDTLISATSQGGVVPTDETVHAHYCQQQVATAGHALESIASCKVEVAIARSISVIHVDRHRQHQQQLLHSIMDMLDQTFPRGSGEKSVPAHLTSGMVSQRVKMRLENFRKKVDRVLANNSILDWMNTPQQVPQRTSVISLMMATSSSSSSEDDESQPASAQFIPSTNPRGLLSRQLSLNASHELQRSLPFQQSISDVTFPISRPNTLGENDLIRSEPSLYKRDSASSLPCSTLSDMLSASMELSSPYPVRGTPLTSDIPSPPPPPHSSEAPSSPVTEEVEKSVIMRAKRSKRHSHLMFEGISEQNEQTEVYSNQQQPRREGLTEKKWPHGLLKPMRSFEGTRGELRKSVDFVDPMREPLSYNTDEDEEDYLRKENVNIMGLQSNEDILRLSTNKVIKGVPDLLSVSETQVLVGPENFRGSLGVEVVESDSSEQEWRKFQVAFQADEFSSTHRLRQNHIHLNRKLGRISVYSLFLGECMRNLSDSLPPEALSGAREDFYPTLSSLNNMIEEVVKAAHTVGALTQECNDNANFKLCFKYVDELKSTRTETLPPRMNQLTRQDSMGSNTSESILINDETMQACIEKFISQPAQALKWPSYRVEFSKFAAHQAQVKNELSLLTKQYENVLKKCERNFQWSKVAWKLVLLIVLLLFLLIMSADSFDKSVHNILFNLRIKS